MLPISGGFPLSFQRFAKGKAWQLEMMVKRWNPLISQLSPRNSVAVEGPLSSNHHRAPQFLWFTIWKFSRSKALVSGGKKIGWQSLKRRRLWKRLTLLNSACSLEHHNKKQTTSQNLFHHTFWWFQFGYLSTSSSFPLKKNLDLNPPTPKPPLP